MEEGHPVVVATDEVANHEHDVEMPQVDAVGHHAERGYGPAAQQPSYDGSVLRSEDGGDDQEEGREDGERLSDHAHAEGGEVDDVVIGDQQATQYEGADRQQPAH